MSSSGRPGLRGLGSTDGLEAHAFLGNQGESGDLVAIYREIMWIVTWILMILIDFMGPAGI